MILSDRFRVLVFFLVLGLAGCGDDERDGVRERVAQYIESEQEVMQRAAPAFERANQTYTAYSQGELDPDAAAEQVAEAERAIRNARDGVLVLDPPTQARPLHDRLLRYLDLNVEFARETSRLVTYAPAAVAALEPLARVNRRLQARLAESEDSDEQARELERFAARLGTIVGDLRALRPPALLRPTHRDQLRRLEETRGLADELEGALRAQDAVKVSRLLERFRGEASAPDARRRLANQALDRYSARLEQVTTAGADVQREQVRLSRSLR